MKRALIIAPVLLLLVVSVVMAVGGSYDLSWFTVDGGGGISSSGAYVLIGTVGQPDAGLSGDGGYSLSSGFLGRETSSNQKVFLPIVIK